MFTHLHLHTDYSLLDGVTRIQDLVKKIKDTGMKSCAITDHGNMYGAFKFYSEMKKNDLKPIIGCEIYIAPRTRFDKEYGIDNKYFHQTLLAMNKQGYKNLLKIVSAGHMDGFYYKPRVDWEILEKYNEGIIALSGCLSGVVSQPLQSGNYSLALENAKKYSNLFKGRFFIEIQRNGIELQEEVNKGLLKISKELDLPIVATCDAHFLDKEDSEVQEVLWCIADGKTLDDPTRRTLQSKEFYVKTPEEMEILFNDLPEAIENTQKISEMIEDSDITFGRIEPKYYDLPKGTNSKDYLKKLTYEGAKKIYGKITKELKTRIDYELSVIDEKKYNDYFLIVQMIVNYCRTNDIVVSMRGSGCGSVVAYCIGITSIDPIAWGLYFERFLNPERKSAPDFDIDLEDRQREKVINFAITKFGEENVRQIITFSRLKTRQAIRDVSRTLGIDLKIADQLSKMVEILFGKSRSFDYMMEHNPEFNEIVNSSDQLKRMGEIVRKIAGDDRIPGLNRGVSVHASGVIIAPEPVVEYVPIQRDAHNEGIGITQYQFMELEEIGLLKFDFLGQRTLSIIGGALKKIRESKGVNIDLLSLKLDDEKTFELIRNCETVGLFQVEGEGMKRSIRIIKPDTVEDLCYLVAAYRPGPMELIPEYAAVKNGKKKAEFLLPELEPILAPTNGVISYQEQVIRIAVDIAGYTMGQADAFRKAMGKKLIEVMEKEKDPFMQGALKKGFDPDKIEKLWQLLFKFANYGFNKAHSAMYAVVAYWTAYLKANYPLEYMAALLEGDLGRFERIIIDLEECERLGFNLLTPSINKSGYYFRPEGEDSIRFGLGAIKNVGGDIVQEIILERETNGEFKSLDDFISRTLDKRVQPRVVEYLIMSGAMDEFGDRQAQLQVLSGLFDLHRKQNEIKSLGQIDLFGGAGSDNTFNTYTKIPEDIITPSHKLLEWEKELLGVYFSSHPLDNLQSFFAQKNVVPIRDVKDKKNKEIIVLGVLISSVKRITTKKGERMAFLTVEDKSGSTDVIVFPRSYEEMKDSFEPNKPVLIAGRVNFRDGEVSVVFEKAKYIDEDKFADEFSGIVFKIGQQHKPEEIASLKSFIRSNPGNTPVKIIMNAQDGLKSVILNYKITLNTEAKNFQKKFS